MTALLPATDAARNSPGADVSLQRQLAALGIKKSGGISDPVPKTSRVLIREL